MDTENLLREKIAKELYIETAKEIRLIIHEFKLSVPLPRTWEEKSQDGSQNYWLTKAAQILAIIREEND